METIELLSHYAQHKPSCKKYEVRHVIHSSQGDIPVHYRCTCGFDTHVRPLVGVRRASDIEYGVELR